MKQTLAMLFVTALLLFSLAGCGEKKDSNTANGPSTGTTCLLYTSPSPRDRG